MSATTMVRSSERAVTRTLVQYSDMKEGETMTMAMVTTAREVRVPVRCGERRMIRGSWVKTAEGLRLRWAVGE
jgi:hypothetical protein